MKLSPIWLFLFLLIVLIISVMFIKKNDLEESFINFYSKTPNNTTNLTIPSYINPVDKLYDSDFFDPKNGNVLRVYGEPKEEGKPDNNGSSVDHIDVIDRSAFVNTYQKGEKIPSGTLSSVPNSYSSWTVYSTDISFANITSNQIIYCAWDQDTYMHLIDLNNKLNACAFMYSIGSSSNPVYTNFNAALNKMKTAKIDVNDNNNTYIFDDTTNMIFYQLTSNIYYAPLTGDIMIQDNKGINNVYSRSGTAISNFSNIGIVSSTTPWIQYDLVGQFMILYFANKLKTIIIILKLNSDNLTYSIVSVSRFLADGSIQKDSNTVIPIPSCVFNKQKNKVPKNPYPMNASVGGSVTCNLSNAQKDGSDSTFGDMQSNLAKGSYQNKQMGRGIQPMNQFGAIQQQALGMGRQGGSGESGGYFDQNMNMPSDGSYGQGGNRMGPSLPNNQYDDYILKTQLMPPICPAWPSVVNNCSQCGKTMDGTQPPNGGMSKPTSKPTTSTTIPPNETSTTIPPNETDNAGDSSNATTCEDDDGNTVPCESFTNIEGFDSQPPDDSSTTTTMAPEQTAGMHSSTPAQFIPENVVVPSPVGYYIRNMGMTPMTGPMDPFTYNGMLSDKPSTDFLPLNSDFSRFGR